jgi:hypothetical protein
VTSAGGDPGDYVADGTGYSYDVCERMAEDLERLIDRMVAFLWSAPAPRTGSSAKVFDDALAGGASGSSARLA